MKGYIFTILKYLLLICINNVNILKLLTLLLLVKKQNRQLYMIYGVEIYILIGSSIEL